MSKNLRVLLLYPPEQTWPEMMCKPNGSLAYPMLAGALLEAGIEVEIYDACVGDEKDDLNELELLLYFLIKKLWYYKHAG